MMAPRKDDICYATTNRQDAVKRIAPACDRLIVVGSPNSSNSLRLVEVAERAGCPRAVLMQRAAEIDWDAVQRHRRLGITAGASAPEVLVDEIIDAFKARFATQGGDASPRREEGHRLQAAARSSERCLRSRWRSIPTSPTKSSRPSSRSYAIGALTSFKGIAEGVENSNYLVHTEAGRYILTLYEKRVKREDLPYFLALMQHLAARRISCPLPVKDRDGQHAQGTCRPPCRAHHVPRRLMGAAAQYRALPGLGEALAHFHLAGTDFPMFRANSLSLPGWRALFDTIGAAADEVVPGLAAMIENGALPSRQALADGAARGRDPRRSLPRQRVLSQRQGLGPDRLLFRLQRHARLRRRHLPQCLVLRVTTRASTSPRRGPCCRPMRACGR